MFTPVIGRPDQLIDYVAEQTALNPGPFYGPWFLALIGNSFVMGILLVQFVRYFSAFGYESKWRFALVIASMILFLVDWSIMLSVEYTWFASHYGDFKRFALIPWQSWLSPPFGQLTAFTSQTFFAHRCYKLYNRNIGVLVGILLGMISSLALFIIGSAWMSVDPYNTAQVKKYLIPALALNLLTDFSITALTLWKLAGQKGTSFSSHTDDILRRLRKMTVEAALPPAICAFVNLVLYLTIGNSSLAFLFFGTMTPGMYVCSLMFMLNSRLTIRRKLNGSTEQSQANAGTYDLTKVTTSRRLTRQTLQDGGNGRGTVVFGNRSRPAYTPTVSIGVVTERIETVEGPVGGLSAFKVDEEDSISQSDVKGELEDWTDGEDRITSKPYTETPAVRLEQRDDLDAQPFPSRKRDSGSPV